MIKTRFAPSPTGYIHIGNVRSAIYPYLLAKQQQGTFLLRIEDTDQARYVEGATELIEDTLRWLGLCWDEGPRLSVHSPTADKGVRPGSCRQADSPSRTVCLSANAQLGGGQNGPYFQSQRKEIYHHWAKKLIAMGRAYADPTPAETIQAYRDECNAKKIPFLYRNFRPASAETPASTKDAKNPENTPEWQPGVPLRFKSDPKPREWHDAVMGDLSAGPEVQDDIILIKADGLPTYNFAHIVDDAEMGVTHVMRGVEYLPSTPNYLALYEALNLDPPIIASLPHILAPSGKKKLGKRDGAKSVTEYRADGILPEAMLNYLACLGWNDGTEQEIYSRAELIKKFSLDKIQSSGARYDETKLLWLNGQWIRKIHDEQGIDALYAKTCQNQAKTTQTHQNTPKTTQENTPISSLYHTSENLSSTSTDFWPEIAQTEPAEYKKQVLNIIYDRLKTLGDLQTMTTYFFEDPVIDLKMITGNKFLKKYSEEELSSMLQLTAEKLTNLTVWDTDTLQDTLNSLLTETGKKPAELFSIIRISLSFAPFSPALHLTMNVLGRERSLARIRKVITALEND